MARVTLRRRAVDDYRMTLMDHLIELRNRLLKSIIALTVATIVCFIFFNPIFDVLKAPYCDLDTAARLGGNECQLFFFGVLDAFFLRLKVAIIAGALFSAPVWLYQLWGFVAPGLHRRERRWGLWFVGSALALFALGSFFAYITLSKGLQLLLGFGGDGLQSLLDVNKYLSYVVAMLLVFGISFLFPLLTVMLNLAGVLSAQRMRSWRRGVIFGLVVFAAVITPSQDPFTMMAMALPLAVFYEITIVFARVHDRRKLKRDRALGLADLDDDEASALPEESPLPGAVRATPGSPIAELQPAMASAEPAPSPAPTPSALDDVT